MRTPKVCFEDSNSSFRNEVSCVFVRATFLQRGFQFPNTTVKGKRVYLDKGLCVAT